jgi:hypothetical protein
MKLVAHIRVTPDSNLVSDTIFNEALCFSSDLSDNGMIVPPTRL